MNILSRLKKMESRINAEDSNFCGCYEKHWRSAIESAYNDNSDIEIEVYPMPDFEKGFCKKCNKPFSKGDIEMDKNIQEIYGEKAMNY
jgi:hypothetical protein